jgi:hypothetical protein
LTHQSRSRSWRASEFNVSAFPPTSSDAVKQQEKFSHLAGWSMSQQFAAEFACVSYDNIIVDPVDRGEIPAPLLPTDLFDASYDDGCSDHR